MKSFHATKHHDVVLSLLRDRREALGIRQADLANKLGQTQAMVSRVETGERRLDIIELRAWTGPAGLLLEWVRLPWGSSGKEESGKSIDRSKAGIGAAQPSGIAKTPGERGKGSPLEKLMLDSFR